MRKPEGKKPLGRLKWSGKNNIKMDIRERGWSGPHSSTSG
jgi:hypothetical protein